MALSACKKPFISGGGWDTNNSFASSSGEKAGIAYIESSMDFFICSGREIPFSIPWLFSGCVRLMDASVLLVQTGANHPSVLFQAM